MSVGAVALVLVAVLCWLLGGPFQIVAILLLLLALVLVMWGGRR